MSRGKLIVFEGVDGSGKTSQINLVSKYLEEKNIPFEAISFPQYGKNKYAKEIKKYLEGKYGQSPDPYEIAKLYASDRLAAKAKIGKWLKDGKLVLANRYVSSNKAYMGANLAEEDREKFFKLVGQMEYAENAMPKEDLTIFLDIDPKVGQKNVREKNKPDIHEDNLMYLEKVGQIYLQLAKERTNWNVVDCMDNTGMKSPEEINKKVVEIVQNMLLSIK